MKFQTMYRYVLTFGRNIGGAGSERTDERVADEHVSAFLSIYVQPEFDGFSVSHHTGYWKGQVEESFSVTILVDFEDDTPIQGIARAYKRLYSQDCVMITRESVSVRFEDGR